MLVWDWQHVEHPTSNCVFFNKPVPATDARAMQLELRHLAPGSCRIQVRRTGYTANDAPTAIPRDVLPKELNEEQLQKLHGLTTDKPEVDRVVRIGSNGKLQWKLPMRSNDIVLFTVEPAGRVR